jgi:hypothetical protein
VPLSCSGVHLARPPTARLHQMCDVADRLEPHAPCLAGPPLSLLAVPGLALLSLPFLFPLRFKPQRAPPLQPPPPFRAKISSSRGLHDRPSTPSLPFVLLEPPERCPFTEIWTERRRRRCLVNVTPRVKEILIKLINL